MIAISTAYKEALIGIEIDGKQSFKRLDSNCKHSENMLYTIDAMLDEMGKSLKENDQFAVVIGPGSFTGIRIGVSLVKGFVAEEDSKNVVVLTTFDLMAYSYIKNFAPTEDFVCILNGLSGYYFMCKYSAQSQKLTEEKLITKEDLGTITEQLIGLEEENVGQVLITPTAEELLEISKKKYNLKEVVNGKEIVPIYLRKSQAESMLKR